MDSLTAFVTIYHAMLRIHIAAFINERQHEMATPKLQGLAEAMKKLEHDLEGGAGKLMAKVEALGPRGLAALAKSNERIDSKVALVGEIEGFVTALEGANGGEPLDDPEEPTHTTPLPEAPSLETPPVERTVVAG